MERCDEYKQSITSFISDLLENGFAKKSADSPKERSWYIPHHGVWQESKKKYRLVFDCSARYLSRSLNDELLQGPDLTNLLIGVLIQFRQGKIAFMGDIEAMFYQVRVPPEYQSFLKFLWWPDGDLTKAPEDYQMCVHLFGAISSPSCANSALRHFPAEGSHASDRAKEVIHKNFYVDDMLGAEDNPDSCIEIIREVRGLCSSADFNLTKFTSNSQKVLDSLPSENKITERSVVLGRN
jgi:hypothetical protein